MKINLLFLVLAASISFTVKASEKNNEDTCVSEAVTIEDKLTCLSGVNFEEKESKLVGYRVFEIYLDQPEDHRFPTGKMFRQKLVLEHRSFDRPMVLQTSGYAIFGIGLSGLAKQFLTNQIQVEHRYFRTSISKDADWSKLNIWQSANDFHRITEKLKLLYTGSWVNTGASKGGMTSLFYRRFFPNDMDGTVADVAPISLDLDDQRYIPFMEQVGGDTYADCRKALESMRIELLQNREQIVPKVEGSFVLSGGIDAAIEDSLEYLPWGFWQYHGVTDCEKVKQFSSLDEKIKYFLDIDAPSDDADIEDVRPYYYQALTELGHQTIDLKDLANLGLDLYHYGLSDIFPENIFGKMPYSNSAILDVLTWLKDESQSMMFIYGQFDPWTAAQVDIREHSDSYKYVVENGNHGSKYYLLAEKEKAEAVATLTRWFHLDSMQPFSHKSNGEKDSEFMIETDFSDTLDQVEANAKMRLKL